MSSRELHENERGDQKDARGVLRCKEDFRKVVPRSDELTKTKPFFLIGQNVERMVMFPTCAMSQRIMHQETKKANYLDCGGHFDHCGFQPGLWQLVS